MNELTALEENVKLLLEAERWDDAIRILEDAAALARQYSSTSWNAGWAYFKVGNFAKAIEWLEHACNLAPQESISKWALGEVLSSAGQHAEAELMFLRAIVWRDSYPGRRGLGFLYHRLGRLDDAEAVYLEGLRLSPEDGRRIEAYADFLSDCGRTEEADRYYEKVKKLRGSIDEEEAPASSRRSEPGEET